MKKRKSPFCINCREKNCQIDAAGVCAMIRAYIKSKPKDEDEKRN